MKAWLRRSAQSAGLHVYTDTSLPTGVDWLRDIRRSGLVGEDPTFFDIGANEGQTCEAILAAWPRATIHAFEPFFAPHARLQSRMSAQPRITAERLALAARAGTLRVQPAAQSVLGSLRDVSTDASAELLVLATVDRYCGERGIERIDVLKTDTEGGDADVLDGAATMLGRQAITFVYAEVTLEPGNRRNTPFESVAGSLRRHDYCFLGLYETYPLHHFEEPNLYCNALFVSRAARRAVTRGVGVLPGVRDGDPT